MSGQVKRLVSEASKQRVLRAQVIDVVRDRCSVRLADNGQVLRGLLYAGGPVTLGQVVFVDFSSRPPIVQAMGQPKDDVVERKAAKVKTVTREFPSSNLGGDGGGYVAEHDHSLDDLSDVDASSPEVGQALVYAGSPDGWVPGAITSSFIGLTDTPDSYDGAIGYSVRVNDTGDGLKFVNPVGEEEEGLQIFAPVVLYDGVAPAAGLAYFLAEDIYSSNYKFIDYYVTGKSERTTDTDSNVLLTINGDTTDANYLYELHSAGSTTLHSISTAASRLIGNIGGYNTNGGFIHGTIKLDESGGGHQNLIEVGASGFSSSTPRRVSIFSRYNTSAEITSMKFSIATGEDWCAGSRCVIIGWRKVFLSPPGGALLVSEVSADVTLDETYTVVLANKTSGNHTITLPAASSCEGKTYWIKRMTAPVVGTVTIDADGSEYIDGTTSITLDHLYDCVEIVSDGSAWRIVAYYQAEHHFSDLEEGFDLSGEGGKLVRINSGADALEPVNAVVDARADDAINTTTWDETTAGVLDAVRDALIALKLLSAS